MQPLTDSAISYFKAGMSVVPINPCNKRPMIKFSTDSLDSEKKIRGYWNTHPYANIALQTKNFFVIDVDIHEG